MGGINFHSKKDDFIKMELFAHFIMFNTVSRSIACISVLQTNHKYPYAIDFKMACLIVRKYFPKQTIRDIIKTVYGEESDAFFLLREFSKIVNSDIPVPMWTNCEGNPRLQNILKTL